MKLTISNQTKWTTRSLRKMIYAGLREFGLENSGYSVRVVPAGQKYACSGYAYYHSGSITMRIPNPHLLSSEEKVRRVTEDFARVLEHEILHTLGLSHRDMREEGYYERGGDAPEWAKGISLEPQKTPAKPSPQDRVAKREEHSRKMVKTWERRMKLARTKLSHWKKKVRYYEKKKAATGPKETK